MELFLSAAVRPTESPEKVAGALENLFPGIKLDSSEGRIEGRGGAESLSTFRRLLREQRILDTARSVMLQGRLGDAVQFRLNKQAATVSRINFPPRGGAPRLYPRRDQGTSLTDRLARPADQGG